MTKFFRAQLVCLLCISLNCHLVFGEQLTQNEQNVEVDKVVAAKCVRSKPTIVFSAQEYFLFQSGTTEVTVNIHNNDSKGCSDIYLNNLSVCTGDDYKAEIGPGNKMLSPGDVRTFVIKYKYPKKMEAIKSCTYFSNSVDNQIIMSSINLKIEEPFLPMLRATLSEGVEKVKSAVSEVGVGKVESLSGQ